jgi:hypothetical protein
METIGTTVYANTEKDGKYYNVEMKIIKIQEITKEEYEKTKKEIDEYQSCPK